MEASFERGRQMEELRIVPDGSDGDKNFMAKQKIVAQISNNKIVEQN